MAQLRDVPKVIRSVGLIAFVGRVWREVGEDHLFTWAAALAYSWLFSLFPFLIFLLSLLPYLPENTRNRASTEMHGFLYASLPDQAAGIIWDNVAKVLDRPRGGLLSLGLLFTIWGASGGMNMTITALERCYEIDRGRAYFKKRGIAIGLTAIVALLVVLVLLLLPIGTMLINWMRQDPRQDVSAYLLLLRYPLALILMFAILNILYYYGPSIKQRFIWITPGALFCVVVWLALGICFRLYVNRFGRYNETYGTVGGVAILLLFFYIDALVLLIGAEINSELDFEALGVQRGSRDFTGEKSLVMSQ